MEQNESRTSVDSSGLREIQSRLDLQYEITRILTRSPARQALSETLHCICRFLGWDLGILWQVHPAQNRLLQSALWHSEEYQYEQFTQAGEKLELEPGQGLPGRVWSQKSPIWIEKISEDHNFPRFAEAGSEGLVTALGFPVVVEERCVGVMEFFSHIEVKPRQDLLEQLEIIGRQIGLLYERSQAQALHRDMEARYRITADAASDAIFTIDTKSTIVFANQAVEKIFGYSPDEMVGQSLNIIVPGRFQRAHEQGMNNYLATGKKKLSWKSVEIPGLRKDGTEVALEISFGEYYDQGQHLFTGIARDITERKRSEGIHKFMLDSGSTLASSLDYNSTLSRVSQLAVPFFADWCAVDMLEDGEIKRLSVAHIDPQKIKFAQEIVSEYPPKLDDPGGVPNVIRTGESEVVFEFSDELLRAASLDPKHYEMLASLDLGSYIVVPLKARDEVFGTITFVRETSTKRFDEEDLVIAKELATRASVAVDNARLFENAKVSAERLQLSLDATALGTWYFGVETGDVQWSQRGREILGIDESFVPSYDLFVSLLHPDDRQHIIDSMNDVIEKGNNEVLDVEYRVIGPHQDLERWAHSRGQIYTAQDSGIRYFIGTMKDITERKNTELKLQQFNKELEHRVSDRTAQLRAANKELEAFSYSVSHDLRAPLRGIVGFSDLLVRQYGKELGAEAQRYLERIQAGTQRMGQLIDDMLTLSRVTRGEMNITEFNISELATEIVEELQRQEPNRLVSVSIQPDLFVRGDKGLFRSVLENLFGNAWKFTSQKQQAEISFGMENKDQQKVFYIKDTGAGFNMEYVHKLFGAFQRLHQNTEFSGTGIGLASVQRIIHRHGGSIWADAKEGEGATFYFTIGQN